MAWLSDLFKGASGEEAKKKILEESKLQAAIRDFPDYSNPMPVNPSLSNVIAQNVPQEISQGGTNSPGIAQAVQATIQDSKKTLGSDLGHFMQSVGYGMIDKPLGREANTWDYLGKTIGQIARLNEGSGLSAGQSIYGDNTTEYKAVVNDLGNLKEEDIVGPNKMALYREYLRRYPWAKSFLAEYFGLPRNYDTSIDINAGPAVKPKYPIGGE